MKIRTIRFTSALPVIGQQFDQSDAQNINVVMYPHAIQVDADRTVSGSVTHFRLYIPWQQIQFVREDTT